MEKEYLTVAEAEKLTGIPKHAIYSGLKAEEFETSSRTKGKRTITLIEKDSLLNFASKKKSPKPAKKVPAIPKAISDPEKEEKASDTPDSIEPSDPPKDSIIEMYERLLSREKEFSEKLEKEKRELIERHESEKRKLEEKIYALSAENKALLVNHQNVLAEFFGNLERVFKK